MSVAVQRPPAEFTRHRFFDWLERNYGLDLRSLALFRIALALLVLGDLYLRAQDLRAFYTDFGVLPRDVFLGRFADPWLVSVHFISGKWQVQAVLFVIAAVFGLMLLVGWRTRLAVAVSWFLLLSLQNRNPIILQGGDTLLRMLLFWGLFLPLGAAYSVDAALSKKTERQPPKRVFSAATIALMVQIALVYWFAALMKTGDEWRQGTAVYYALSLEQLSTPIGRWLVEFPTFLRFLTYFTVVVEALAPFFLFSPFLSGPVRSVAIMFLIAIQLGFRAGLDTGHFPFVASVMMLAMLPSYFWESGPDESPRTLRRRGLTMYFDGVCDFCRKMALIVRELIVPDVPLKEAQSDPNINRRMQEQRSWVLVDGSGRIYYRTEALAELLAASPIFIFWPLARVLRWKPTMALGDKIYSWVERSRPGLSRATGFLRPRPLRWRASWVENLMVVLILGLVIWWNIGMKWPERMMPVGWRAFPVAIRVDQIWDMFAPSPLRDDGWYVVPGTFRNGQRVDIFRDGTPVSWARPTAAEVAAQYKNERWRKYLLNLYGEAYTPYRLYYARYLCRKWNEGKSADDPDSLHTFEIYFMARNNAAVGVSLPVQQWMLHRHYCFR